MDRSDPQFARQDLWDMRSGFEELFHDATTFYTEASRSELHPDKQLEADHGRKYVYAKAQSFLADFSYLGEAK